ncbi:MAG: glycosyltransferase family 4 protein [Candidatus Kerfeldbacteria bacterium]|nr:glycosyltransferase family 4 protein [Candidatus Kerfeldbacteria bacterium]
MQIGIDARAIVEERPSGVGWYALELTRRMIQQSSQHQFVLFSVSWSKPNYPSWTHAPNVQIVHRRVPSKLFHLAEWMNRWPHISELIGDCDVFWMPNVHFTSWSSRIPAVLTIHDLSYVHEPGFFTWKGRLWHRAVSGPRLAKHAQIVVADSQHTRQDLVDLWKLPESKIRVVALGVDVEQWKADTSEIRRVRDHYKLMRPYILFMGNVEPRKNVRTLIESFQRARKQIGPAIDLVIVGKPPKTPSLHPYLRTNPSLVPFIRSLGYVLASDRAALYRGAALFVYPSLYEGFGLPILEAMASEVPVVTSPISSLPEVAGDAVMMANPYNIAELARAIVIGIQDHTLRSKLVRRGLERVQIYSWEKTASQMLDIFTEVAS